MNDEDRRGWLTPENEIIPVLRGKGHLESITTYAEKHKIVYDKLVNVYFTFVNMGYIWFTKGAVIALNELTDLQKNIIENYTGEELKDKNIFIYKKKHEKTIGR